MSDKKRTFEESLERLDEILEIISSQSSSLENNLALYQEGVEIIKELEKELARANDKIKKVVEIK